MSALTWSAKQMCLRRYRSPSLSGRGMAASWKFQTIPGDTSNPNDAGRCRPFFTASVMLTTLTMSKMSRVLPRLGAMPKEDLKATQSTMLSFFTGRSDMAFVAFRAFSKLIFPSMRATKAKSTKSRLGMAGRLWAVQFSDSEREGVVTGSRQTERVDRPGQAALKTCAGTELFVLPRAVKRRTSILQVAWETCFASQGGLPGHCVKVCFVVS